MAERRRDRPQDRRLRWAAGLALGVVGATAIFDRLRPARVKTAPADAVPDLEDASGRGAPQGPVNAPSLKAGYEVADTNVRVLVIIMVVSVALMVGGVAAVFWMYAGFDRHFRAPDASMTVEQRAPIVPPLPHLQAEPFREIDATLLEQKRQLTTYGWGDPSHKQAHIPIERAMRLVVGKPLDPAAQAKGAAPSAPLPSLPAAQPQAKPATHVPGEGRPGVVAPSYDPREPGAPKP